MRKNGKSAAGTQRWKCTDCSLTATAPRPDLVQAATFTAFQAYVLGKMSQSELDGTSTGRSLRRRFNWCWDVPIPRPPVTGVIHDQVFLDGKHVSYNWMLLTAVDQDGYVINWQWASSENVVAYQALLEPLPPPSVVTVDGARGGLKAITNTWGDQTRLQRCLLHIHRNNIRDLTRNPQTMAGKALLGLSRALLHIHTMEEAAKWESLLNDFHNLYANYLKERTTAKQNPEMARIRGKQWWYTHERDRRVYFRLAHLVRQGDLFTYLNSATDTANLHSTTNIVESLNARINELIYLHRGLSESHLISAIEWLLHSKTEHPTNPKTVLQQWNQAGKPKTRVIPKKTKPQPRPLGPRQYDTALTTEEGLWARKGWAGRWQP